MSPPQKIQLVQSHSYPFIALYRHFTVLLELKTQSPKLTITAAFVVTEYVSETHPKARVPLRMVEYEVLDVIEMANVSPFVPVPVAPVVPTFTPFLYKFPDPVKVKLAIFPGEIPERVIVLEVRRAPVAAFVTSVKVKLSGIRSTVVVAPVVVKFQMLAFAEHWPVRSQAATVQ